MNSGSPKATISLLVISLPKEQVLIPLCNSFFFFFFLLTKLRPFSCVLSAQGLVSQHVAYTLFPFQLQSLPGVLQILLPAPPFSTFSGAQLSPHCSLPTVYQSAQALGLIQLLVPVVVVSFSPGPTKGDTHSPTPTTMSFCDANVRQDRW